MFFLEKARAFYPQKIHSRLSKRFMEKMETFLSIEFAEWQRCGLRGIKSETQKMEGFFLPGIITPLFLKPLFVDVIGFLSLPCSRVFKQHQRVDRFLR